MTENSQGPTVGTDPAVQIVPENPDPDLYPKAIAARMFEELVDNTHIRNQNLEAIKKLVSKDASDQIN